MKKNKQIDFAKKLLNKIEKENIKPTPKWYFLLKNIVFWFLFFLFFSLGILVVSIIILNIFQMDFSVINRMSGGLFRHFVLFLPYTLIIALIASIIFALEGFIHTKYGYRYASSVVLIGILLGSIFLGIFFSSTKIVKNAEHYAGRFGGHYYEGIEARKKNIWSRVDSGLLAGNILSTTTLEENLKFSLLDFNNKTWFIDISKLDNSNKKIPETFSEVAIIGIKKDENLFEACQIIPWESLGKRGGMKNFFLGENFIDFSKRKGKGEKNFLELKNIICE